MIRLVGGVLRGFEGRLSMSAWFITYCDSPQHLFGVRKTALCFDELGLCGFSLPRELGTLLKLLKVRWSSAFNFSRFSNFSEGCFSMDPRQSV